MKRQRSMSPLIAIGFMLACTAGARAQSIPPPSDETRGDPTVIAGTLELNGCSVDPASLVVRAVPTRVGGIARSRGVGTVGVENVPSRELPAVQLPSRDARFEATEDPHVFRFSIAGLQPSQLYRLFAATPPNPCDHVFWRASSDGLVVPGTSSVRLEGFVARTKVEVRSLRTQQWVGMDDLRFDDPLLSSRTFRWRTSLDNVTAGEIQIAIDSFPTRGAFGPCDEPAGGLIYRQRVAAAPGRWLDLPAINFSSLLSPFRTVGFAAFPGAIAPADYERLESGHPVYVRVVPVTREGPVCDVRAGGVHGWVILAKLPERRRVAEPLPLPRPLAAGTGQSYAPPYIGGDLQGHPTYSELAYSVVKAHTLPTFEYCTLGLFPPGQQADPLGCQLVIDGAAPGGSVLPAGVWFYLGIPHSGGGSGDLLSGFVSTFDSFATGFIDAVGLGVNFLHDLTESIKNSVASVVVDVLNTVPFSPCAQVDNVAGSGACQKLVKAGIEAGLTAVGVPPSVPDFKQLEQQGIEYLASEIASQTGAPDFVTEAAMEDVAQGMVDAMAAKQGGPGPQYNWVTPYLGFDPAVWTITVRRNTTAPLPKLAIVRPKLPLFGGASVPLPSKFPSSKVLTIPMALQPNLAGIPPPYCATDFFGDTTCVPIAPQLIGLCIAGAFGEAPCPFLAPAGPVCATKSHTVGDDTYHLYDCTLSQFPAIYYRDRWTLQKYLPTNCTGLGAASYATGAFGIPLVPFPNPPFVDFAILPAKTFASWDGATYFGPGCQ